MEHTDRRRLVVWGLVLAYAVGLILLLVSVGGRRTARASDKMHVLPTGHILQFVAVQPAGQPFTTDSAFMKWARRWLPTFLAARLPPPQTGFCSSISNSITAYFRMTDPAFVSPWGWDHYYAEDDSGFPYPTESGGCSFGSGSNKIVGLAIRCFPRRQKEFLLKLFDGDNKVVGSFVLPNPLRASYPAWQSKPLPQSCTNGPVTLTLTGLTTSSNAWGNWHKLQWELKASDPLWNGAKVFASSLLDAQGNEGQGLSPAESAWKVRALVHRSASDDFTPAERMTIKNVRVPQAATFAWLESSHEVSGVKINVRLIAGAGRLFITNGADAAMLPFRGSPGHGSRTGGRTSVESWSREKPFALVEAQGLTAEDELTFELGLDGSGDFKRVEACGYTYVDASTRCYTPLIENFAPSNSWTLRIFVNRALPFEFMVNPNDATRSP